MLPTFLRECEKHKKNFKSLPPDMDPFYESSGGQPRLNRQCQWVLGQNKVVSELPKEWEHLIRDIDAERRNIEAQKRAKREKRTEAQGRKAVQEDRKKNIKTINAGKPLETTVDLSSFIKPPRAKQPKANKPKFQGNFSDLPLDEDGCILDRSGNALEERF